MLDEYNSVFKFSFVVTPINPFTSNIPFSNSHYCLFYNCHDVVHRSDEGLTLETSAFKLFTMANLRLQLSW